MQVQQKFRQGALVKILGKPEEWRVTGFTSERPPRVKITFSMTRWVDSSRLVPAGEGRDQQPKTRR